VKGWKQKNSNKRDSAKPEEPLSVEETQKYYDLDEFNEELAKLEDAGEQDDASSGAAGKSKNPDKQEDRLMNESGPEEVNDDDDRETVGDSDTDGELKTSESVQETPQKKQKNKNNELMAKGKTQNAKEQNIPLKGN